MAWNSFLGFSRRDSGTGVPSTQTGPSAQKRRAAEKKNSRRAKRSQAADRIAAETLFSHPSPPGMIATRMEAATQWLDNTGKRPDRQIFHVSVPNFLAPVRESDGKHPRMKMKFGAAWSKNQRTIDRIANTTAADNKATNSYAQQTNTAGVKRMIAGSENRQMGEKIETAGAVAAKVADAVPVLGQAVDTTIEVATAAATTAAFHASKIRFREAEHKSRDEAAALRSAGDIRSGVVNATANFAQANKGQVSTLRNRAFIGSAIDVGEFAIDKTTGAIGALTNLVTERVIQPAAAILPRPLGDKIRGPLQEQVQPNALAAVKEGAQQSHPFDLQGADKNVTDKSVALISELNMLRRRVDHPNLKQELTKAVDARDQRLQWRRDQHPILQRQLNEAVNGRDQHPILQRQLTEALDGREKRGKAATQIQAQVRGAAARRSEIGQAVHAAVENQRDLHREANHMLAQTGTSWRHGKGLGGLALSLKQNARHALSKLPGQKIAAARYERTEQVRAIARKKRD
ncbi:hypothetical protein N9Y97_01850 [Pseudomonadales bacterium]|nr:hypothetical protein [Pseudomonadales bacterium]